jgi:hypothetical protein
MNLISWHNRLKRITWFLVVLLTGAEMSRHAFAAAKTNLVKDGDFEHTVLQPAKKSAPELWTLYAPGNPLGQVAVTEKAGRNGSAGVSFHKTATNYENIHLDQVVQVKPDSVYQVTAWVRGDGKVNPVLAVMTMGWAALAMASSHASTQWTEVKFVFQSITNEQVRLEWFPGAAGKLYTGAGGASWLDDVCITALDPVPPALVRALTLAHPSRGKEINLSAVKTGPVGKPLPLRPIVCNEGALRYEDGTEVALYGVNFQTALSWEYHGRMKPCGISLTADALKEIVDRNLAEIKRMNAGIIRMHLLPADFTDGQGGLRDSVYLDALDYTFAQCEKQGIYVYLTLMNEMKSSFYKDSFLEGHPREEWLVNEDLIRQCGRYVREILQHTNRYSGVRYKDQPALGIIEILNEPGYVAYDTMQIDARFSDLRQRFAHWQAANPSVADPRAAYHAFRYEYVRDYINRMCGFIREAGAKQPVVWNLNWPHMIWDHEDVFQAVADSSVAAVSFCIYPGQSDVPSPYWAHPAELSGTNYLPFLSAHYTDYSRLRWLLGERFAGKAKCVYEFETMFNQSGYLYPAIAGLFRGLGAQVAMMWTYSLSPTAEYLGGSHYLNLYCTPQKAAAFCIAEAVFHSTPRYAPFACATPDSVVTPHWAASFSHNLGVFQSEDTLMYSRSLEWQPWPINPRVKKITGTGDSPLVSYSGTGMYFVDVGPNRISVNIMPDVRYLRPHWQHQNKKPWEKTRLLDSLTEHPFGLEIPGWQANFQVLRVEGERKIPIATEENRLRFQARPGGYVVERARKP